VSSLFPTGHLDANSWDNSYTMDLSKGNSETIEHVSTQQEPDMASKERPVMRSKVDDMTVWQSVKQFKLVSLVAMAAAFSASLDGYRTAPGPNSKRRIMD
jgi:hypothetical protein